MRRISDSGFGYALGKLIRSSHALISHDHRTNLESRSSVESNLRVENLELEVDTEQQQRSRQRQKWRGGPDDLRCHSECQDQRHFTHHGHPAHVRDPTRVEGKANRVILLVLIRI